MGRKANLEKRAASRKIGGNFLLFLTLQIKEISIKSLLTFGSKYVIIYIGRYLSVLHKTFSIQDSALNEGSLSTGRYLPHFHCSCSILYR